MSAITKSDHADNNPGSATARRARSRAGRVIAGTLVAGLTVTGLAVTGGQSAGAAAPLRAQSVGRLVDGTIGTNSLESLVDVHDARATAPGTQSVQNPLDVTAFNSLNVNLTGVINLPTSPTIVAGAANQVAVAHLDGFSYGAAGAVSNSGGANIGGTNDSFPAFGTINLSGSALPPSPLPLPGAGDLASLGGITASIGAVAALAQTKVGGAVSPAPSYVIAGLNLTLASPALGGVLAQLGAALNPAGLPGLPNPISLPGATIPAACTFTAAFLAPISFAGGAVTINPTGGVITISLAKLLTQLGLDINALPANTDLLAYLLNYLADPNGLAKGLRDVITSITQPGQDRLTACLTAIGAQTPAAQLLLAPLVILINNGSVALTAAAKQLTDALAAAAPTNPFRPLADGLKQLIDIGINVESGPGIQPVQTNPALMFTTQLAKTPNQATPVVTNQTLIRALEIDLIGDPAAVVALANAAVGPSTAAPVSPTTPASTTPNGAVNTNIPTGVPAGFAKPAGSPELPLILLVVGLLMASGGAVAWKFRGKHVA